MKQLLLLLTIHMMIFYQQSKNKKEKFLATLEKKSTVNIKPAKSWDFLLSMRQANVKKRPQEKSKPVAYNFSGYSYLNALVR